MFTTEFDGLPVVRFRDDFGRRVVGAVQPQQNGPPGVVRIDRPEVGEEVVGRPKRHVDRVGSPLEGARRVGRIPRVRDQHHVPRIDEGHGKGKHRLLRSQGGGDLRGRIQLDLEPVFEPVGHRLPEEVLAVVTGVALFRTGERLDRSGLPGHRRRRIGGVADPEINDVVGAEFFHGPVLGFVDFGEGVAADALEIGTFLRLEAHGSRPFQNSNPGIKGSPFG